jgi:lipoyl-dependent peroxiredoxin
LAAVSKLSHQSKRGYLKRAARQNPSKNDPFIRVRPIFILGTVYMKPNASATWVGGLRRGKGVLTTGSGALSQSQNFRICDRKGKGIHPYELIAAAHAACFSVTLANELAGAGFCPHRINTTATVTMESLRAGWTITGIQLDVVAEVPWLKQNDFIRAAISAKTHCTISRLLNANLSMSAKLENYENRGMQKVRRPADSLRVSENKKQSIG